MAYSYEEVMDIVSDVLGTNAEMLAIHDDAAYGDIDMFDMPIYVNRNCDEFDVDAGYPDYHVCAGRTKLVIEPRDLKYVIKIPFTYRWHEEEDDGEAYFNEVQYDILGKEENIYNQVSENVREFLLPNTFIGFFNRIPIYVQDKVDETLGQRSFIFTYAKLTPLEQKKARYLASHTYSTGVYLIPYIEKMGMRKLIKTMLEIHYELSDLHDDNLGFINNEIKIIDYGGYSSQELWG